MSRHAKEAPWFERRKGSTTFYAFWYDRGTQAVKRISLGTKDPVEAKARFAAFLSEGEAMLKPTVGGLTVSQALDSYWTEHVLENCAAAYRQEYAIRHLKGFFGATILSEVDIPLSRAYAAHRREQGAADGTIRRELSVLVAAANHARRWKRLTEMPSIELTAGRTLSQDEQAPFYTKEQLKVMFEAAEGEFRCFLELLYWTGARRQAIAELEWDQVKADHILLQKPGTKATKKRRPIVPILPEMKPVLARLKALTGHGRRVFTLNGPTLYWRFKALCADLGLPGHPHWYRHSRATHLLQDGVTLYAVARLLGDTVATVERVYGHHSHDDLARHLAGPAGQKHAALS